MTDTDQPDLFTVYDPPEPRDRVADLEAGREARDAGSALALDAVDRWRVVADEALDALIREGEPFTSDDVADRAGDPPESHRNAMGGLFSAASKQNRIEAAGYTQATRPSAHARVIRVWGEPRPDPV